MKMELQDVFEALREATVLLARHSVTFVETPVDEEGNELEEEKTHMDLRTLIVRMMGEVLLERGKTKEEIEEALKSGGDSTEVPTGNRWHLLVRGLLG